MYSEEEFEALKDRLDSVRRENDELLERREAILGEHEHQLRAVRREVEQDWRGRLDFAEAEAGRKVAAATNELDLVRAGLNGDSCGWISLPDKTYRNEETGEVRQTEPEVLYIATIVSKAEETDKLREETKALQNKAERALLSKNEAEIQVQKLKTELSSFRALNGQWIEASRALASRISAHEEECAAQTRRQEDALDRLASRDAQVVIQTASVVQVTAKVRALNALAREQRSSISDLRLRVQGLEGELASRQRIVDRLTTSFNEEVESRISPIRIALAASTAHVLRLNADKIRDLRDMAVLWPETHLMPTLLCMHRARSKEDRDRLARKARENQASLALALDVRRRVKESKHWTTDYDDYGQLYYRNTVTGDVLKEEPEVVRYKPPPDRNELGGRIEGATADSASDYRLVKAEGDVILYKHKDTEEVVEELPGALSPAPPSRSMEHVVKESAQIVLSYLKQQLIRRRELQEGRSASDGERQDLDRFMYDIECVEMLAALPEYAERSDPLTTKWRPASDFIVRSSANGSASKAEGTSYPRLFEVDIEMVSLKDIRGILADIAAEEEAVEHRLHVIRSDLKEYSFLLSNRVKEIAPEAQRQSTDDPVEQPLIPSDVSSGKFFDIASIEDSEEGTGMYLFGDLSYDYSLDDGAPSEEVVRVAEDLCCFAVFCGYRGVDSRKAYSSELRSLLPSAVSASDVDDEWLSSHFFLTASKEKVDALYSGIINASKEYFLGSFDAPKSTSYSDWRDRQLTAEVLRFQLQEEAVSSLHQRCEIPSHLQKSVSPTLVYPGFKHMLLRIRRLQTSPVQLQPWDEFVHVRCSIGTSWHCRTHSIPVKSHPWSWDYLEISVAMDEDRLKFDQVVLEVCTDRELVVATVVGRTCFPLAAAMKSIGKSVEVEAAVDYGDAGISKMTVVLTADDVDFSNASSSRAAGQVAQDKLKYEHSRAVSEKQKPSLLREQESFNNLVSSLRGDPAYYRKMLTANIDGAEVNATGFQVSPKVMKSLPNFKAMRAYLSSQDKLHMQSIRLLVHDSESLQSTLKVQLEEVTSALTGTIMGIDSKVNGFETIISELKVDLRANESLIAKLKRAIPPPTPPTFQPLAPLILVPPFPSHGSLNAKGKTKKKMRTFMVDDVLKKIVSGGHDGVDWDFGENWPDAAQEVQLREAALARNAYIEAKRAAEVSMRAESQELYEKEYALWVKAEAERESNLNETKKSSRLVNLAIESNLSKIALSKTESQALRDHIKVLQRISDLQKESSGRCCGALEKIKIERRRLVLAVLTLKRKLVKIVHARRNALKLPESAVNAVNFEYLRGKAEHLLKILRYETVDCKHDAVAEGDRLKSLHHEELSVCTSELNKVKFFSNMLKQSILVNSIIASSQVDVIHVMDKLEKCTIEAAKSDTDAVERTVNKLGEKYLNNVEWDDAQVIACVSELAAANTKHANNTSIRSSFVHSQASALDAMAVKWSSTTPLASLPWYENSDFERAKQVESFVLNWLKVKCMRLESFEKLVLRQNQELVLQLLSLRRQNDLNFKSHIMENVHVKDCALNVIDTLQRRLAAQEAEFKVCNLKLEEAILEVTKECQEVREKAALDSDAFEEKLKLLRIMLKAMEYSLTHANAQLSVITTEKNTMQLTMLADIEELRHELRRERKHASNLYFIIHSLRSRVKDLKLAIHKLEEKHVIAMDVYKTQNKKLRREVYAQVFCLSHLSTDVKSLFEFFSSRVANIAGSRKFINDELVKYNAGEVLAALTKSSSMAVKKFATKGLAGLGWNAHTQTRQLMWDCVKYWGSFVSGLHALKSESFEEGFQKYLDSGKIDVIVPIDGSLISDSEPPREERFRVLLSKRKQWALRHARRKEGPYIDSSGKISSSKSIIESLILSISNPSYVDWEIIRNVTLALSISSYDDTHRQNILEIPHCVELLVSLCSLQYDVEANCYVAITIANLCFNDEQVQFSFGNCGALPALLALLSSIAVDVLESVTGALVNLTSICDRNCSILMSINGVATLICIIKRSISENLLDLDQNNEVQANAIETLTNISRYNCDMLAAKFDSETISCIALLCASNNMLLKRQAALILGNIAQNATCRMEICSQGGIEALALLLEERDSFVQASSLWALSNLMWYAPNQDKAGRYLDKILEFLIYPVAYVRKNAFLLLANLLYYNNSTCDRFLSTDAAIELLIDVLDTAKLSIKDIRNLRDIDSLIARDSAIEEKRVDSNLVQVLDCCLRSLLSLSCVDSASLWLGSVDSNAKLFLTYCDPRAVSVAIAKTSLEIIANLCIHDANRRCLINNRAVEVLVELFVHDSPEISQLANHIVDRLKDLAPPDFVARVRANIGEKNMLQLTAHEDPLVRLAAVEDVSDRALKGTEADCMSSVIALLKVCENHMMDVNTLIPSIWSLKSMISGRGYLQSHFGENDGVAILIKILSACMTLSFGSHTSKVLESSLLCLQAAVTENKRSSRFLVQHSKGLDLLLQISGENLNKRSFAKKLKSDPNSAVASSILHNLGKFNYVICRHCSKKQDVSGTSCLHCGHKLLFDVVDTSKPRLSKAIAREEQPISSA